MRQLLLFSIVAGASWSGTAVAAAQEAPPIEQLASDAAIAGVGTVQSVSARVNPTNNMIYTDFVLKFSDIWKGDPADPFTLTKVGGRIGGRTISVPGHEYTMNVGDSIAVFAIKNQFGDYVTLGIHEGMFRIDPKGDNLATRVLGTKSERLSPLPLQTLREKVFRALGKPWVPPPPRIDPSKSSKPFGAAASPDAVPSVPATPQSPARDPESRGRSYAGLIVGLLILAAAIAVFVHRKSKADANHSR